MKALMTVQNALLELFDNIDRERFDRIADMVDADVELADELTGEWLRGRERVAAYLVAQKGVVTDVSSRLHSISCRWIAPEVALSTFIAEQHYSLDSVPRREELSGSVIFSFRDGEPRLLLFHLGAAATARPGGEQPDGASPARKTRNAPPRTLPQMLRRRRKELGFSLRDLASRSGLSASFLSQLERGVVEPSLSSLKRIAKALRMSVSDLIGEGSRPDRAVDVVVRHDSRRRIDLPDTPATYELVSSGEKRMLEVSIVSVEPVDTASIVPRTHPGEEFVFVLDGRLRLVYGGEEIELSPGDAASIEGWTPHALTAEGDQFVRYLSVVTSRS